MDPLTAGIIGIVALLVLLASRMPVAFVLFIVGFLGFAYLAGPGPALSVLGIVPYGAAAAWMLAAIPMFILMGQFAFFSGISQDIYTTAYKWLGHLPGGLCLATLGGCAGFAAASGSSTATAAAMGMVALPEMKKYGYDRKLATGTVAAGGTLGILIPPSIALVVYGIITEVSIGRLLIAGILPGILSVVIYMAMIYVRVRRNPGLAPPAPRAPWGERFSSLRGVWGILTLFVVVIGGIFAGIFTPTEAAAVGALGSFVIVLARGRLSWQNLTASLMETGRMTAMIFAIVIGAFVFGYFLAITQIPFEFADFAVALPIGRYGILALLLVMYVFLGMVMSALAMILLTVPIVFPVVLTLGFDPIWFGIIVVKVMEIALITPPIGLNVYVLSGVAKDVPLTDIFRGIFPFLLMDFLTLGILIALPQISLFLPNLMMG